MSSSTFVACACLVFAALPVSAADAGVSVDGGAAADAGSAGDDAPPAVPPLATSADDEELFTKRPDDAPTTAALDDMIEAAEAATSVGGRMHLALTYSTFESLDVVRFPWTSPSFLDLYVDARPSDRVRAFAQARVDYDFTLQAGGVDFLGRPAVPVAASLDQLWVGFDVARVAFLTLGRQHARWGVGRVWNATDFLNQETRDALDVVDRRLGVDMVKLHVPFEALRWNNYVVVSLREALAPATAGLAARTEIALWTTEVAASAAARLDEPLRIGVDGSIGAWLFDLKGEAALLYGSQADYWRGSFDPARGVKPVAVRRDDELFFRGVAGVEVEIPYAAGDAAIVGCEYFYNGLGYDDPSVVPWLLLAGDLDPLYVGRHYIAAYAVVVDPFALDDVSLSATNVGNLSDLSFLTRLDVRTTFLTHLQIGVFVAAHYGRTGELHLALDVPPQEEFPWLPAGIRVPRQVVDVGGTLTLAF